MPIGYQGAHVVDCQDDESLLDSDAEGLSSVEEEDGVLDSDDGCESGGSSGSGSVGVAGSDDDDQLVVSSEAELGGGRGSTEEEDDDESEEQTNDSDDSSDSGSGSDEGGGGGEVRGAMYFFGGGGNKAGDKAGQQQRGRWDDWGLRKPERPLPPAPYLAPGWQVKRSRRHQDAQYYYFPDTGESTWEKPVIVPGRPPSASFGKLRAGGLGSAAVKKPGTPPGKPSLPRFFPGQGEREAEETRARAERVRHGKAMGGQKDRFGKHGVFGTVLPNNHGGRSGAGSLVPWATVVDADAPAAAPNNREKGREGRSRSAHKTGGLHGSGGGGSGTDGHDSSGSAGGGGGGGGDDNDDRDDSRAYNGKTLAERSRRRKAQRQAAAPATFTTDDIRAFELKPNDAAFLKSKQDRLADETAALRAEVEEKQVYLASMAQYEAQARRREDLVAAAAGVAGPSEIEAAARAEVEAEFVLRQKGRKANKAGLSSSVKTGKVRTKRGGGGPGEESQSQSSDDSDEVEAERQQERRKRRQAVRQDQPLFNTLSLLNPNAEGGKKAFAAAGYDPQLGMYHDTGGGKRNQQRGGGAGGGRGGGGGGGGDRGSVASSSFALNGIMEDGDYEHLRRIDGPEGYDPAGGGGDGGGVFSPFGSPASKKAAAKAKAKAEAKEERRKVQHLRERRREARRQQQLHAYQRDPEVATVEVYGTILDDGMTAPAAGTPAGSINMSIYRLNRSLTGLALGGDDPDSEDSSGSDPEHERGAGGAGGAGDGGAGDAAASLARWQQREQGLLRRLTHAQIEARLKRKAAIAPKRAVYSNARYAIWWVPAGMPPGANTVGTGEDAVLAKKVREKEKQRAEKEKRRAEYNWMPGDPILLSTKGFWHLGSCDATTPIFTCTTASTAMVPPSEMWDRVGRPPVSSAAAGCVKGSDVTPTPSGSKRRQAAITISRPPVEGDGVVAAEDRQRANRRKAHHGMQDLTRAQAGRKAAVERRKQGSRDEETGLFLPTPGPFASKRDPQGKLRRMRPSASDSKLTLTKAASGGRIADGFFRDGLQNHCSSGGHRGAGGQW